MDGSLGKVEPGRIRDSGLDDKEPESPLYCPICETPQPHFLDFNGRKNVRCNRCSSLERHRSVWIYFREHTDLFEKPDRSFLHLAPERCFADRFASFFNSGYLTADLHMENVKVKMDIMNMPFPDLSFEVVYSSHVLEHVENYPRALAELYRVLAPHGWMVLLVTERGAEPTYRFAQVSPIGHIWSFGSDFSDVLRQTGFQVRRTTVAQLFTAHQIKSLRLKRRQEIFHCFK